MSCAAFSAFTGIAAIRAIKPVKPKRAIGDTRISTIRPANRVLHSNPILAGKRMVPECWLNGQRRSLDATFGDRGKTFSIGGKSEFHAKIVFNPVIVNPLVF